MTTDVAISSCKLEEGEKIQLTEEDDGEVSCEEVCEGPVSVDENACMIAVSPPLIRNGEQPIP